MIKVQVFDEFAVKGAGHDELVEPSRFSTGGFVVVVPIVVNGVLSQLYHSLLVVFVIGQ